MADITAVITYRDASGRFVKREDYGPLQRFRAVLNAMDNEGWAEFDKWSRPGWHWIILAATYHAADCAANDATDKTWFDYYVKQAKLMRQALEAKEP